MELLRERVPVGVGDRRRGALFRLSCPLVVDGSNEALVDEPEEGHCRGQEKPILIAAFRRVTWILHTFSFVVRSVVVSSQVIQNTDTVFEITRSHISIIPSPCHFSSNAPTPTGAEAVPFKSFISSSSYSLPNDRKCANKLLKCGSERRCSIWW